LLIEEIENNTEDSRTKLLKEELHNISKSDDVVIDIHEDATNLSAADRLYIKKLKAKKRNRVLHETPSTNQNN
jgi:hypothetical protein